MNNKYDVALSQEEKEKLITSITQIKDYLTDLVKDFDTEIELKAEWTIVDSVWGVKRRTISVERTFKFKGVWGNSEKVWYTRVSGGRAFNFEENNTLEEINYSTNREYALSLIDKWQSIKECLLEQLEQAKATKQLVNDFKI